MDLFVVYLICFGVGLLCTLVSACFAHDFGGGHDGPAHAGAEHSGPEAGSHGMPGFSPLSPTTIAAFITSFGGLGMIFHKLDATSSAWLSLLIATIGGFIVAALLFCAFRAVFRATQSSSEGRVAELFGHSATVLTPIRAGGVGEIAYEQGGTRYTGAARTDGSLELPAGATVRIVRVVGSQFYVIQD